MPGGGVGGGGWRAEGVWRGWRGEEGVEGGGGGRGDKKITLKITGHSENELPKQGDKTPNRWRKTWNRSI